MGTIAVIIPAYNQAAYLADAVASVFAQTRLPDQVILINDGSTDATGTVAQGLTTQHPEITYLTQSNAGVGVACQTGLAAVTSDYVIRLDADDTMPNNYIAELEKALAGQPKLVSFAYSSARLFGASEGWIHAHRWSVGRLVPENYIHVSSLVRTEVAREVGYFDTTLKGYEDWDFYLKLAERGYRGVFCRTTYLNYRQKPDGGRNTMDRDRDRGLRAEIRAKHPLLYRNPWYQFRILCWRVIRRIKHWLNGSLKPSNPVS